MMMMMKGNLMVDENLSVLRNETLYNSHHSSASTIDQPPPPSKKKRNLPGNPDPDAEVIAMSPKALMATNRFVCEICKKGFQRDQNLQLHRRGHNLPWKLKQRGNKELVRKKVYVCPEATCVHHNASRALGDLTGIKKHFFRKHGEKKWKCEKCSKRYAVQSDWKAHSKICGTREYKCDCGTLFSRRDSFITHRAFCDVLAHQKNTNFITSPPLNNINNSILFPHLKIETQDNYFPSIPSSNINNNILLPFQNPNPTSIGLFGLPPSPSPAGSSVLCPAWEMMAFEEPSFEEALNGILMNNTTRVNKDGGGGAGEITRDFLGLRAVVARQPDHRMFENEIVINDMSNLDSSSSAASTFGLHQNHQFQQTTFWRD